MRCQLVLLVLLSFTIDAPLWARPLPVQAPPATVRGDAIRAEQIQERRLVTGEVRAKERALVAAEEPGRVASLSVVEGQRVERGAMLVELDATRLQIELAINEASTALAEATLAEAKARWQQADRDLKSLSRLDAEGAANPKELADAATTLATAEAKRLQAERQVALEKKRRDLLARRRADMRIYAPFAGVVLSRKCELGEWVAEGDPVVELVSTDALEVWLSVPQRYYSALTTGTPTVVVDVDATAQRIESSHLRVVPDVDSNARNFPLIVDYDGPGLAAPGVSVSAWVPVGNEGEHLTVHKDAVLRGDTGAFIYLAREMAKGKVAMMVPVRVLFANGDRVAIESTGIKAGDLAIVEGNESLYPMAPVAPFTKDEQKP